MSRLTSVLAVGGLAALSACGIAPPNTGRQDVRDEVRARLDVSMAPGEGAEEVGKTLDALLVDGQLTADEAVRFALANNQQLQGILLDLDIAHAELWQASLFPNPVLAASLRFKESGKGEILELGVAESVIDLLLQPRRKQIAGLRFEQVETEVTAAVLDLASEVRVAYREIQAQVELAELFGSAVEMTFLSFDAARRLYEAGNIVELDVLQEQALFEDAKLALVNAQTKSRIGRERINALLGIWGAEGEAWTLEPRLPMPATLDVSAAELEGRVLEASLDLKAMHQSIMAIGHASGLKRLEVLFPEISLGATAEREADGEWSIGPVTSLSVPVFDFGRAASAGARARVEQAYSLYTDLAIRVRRTARSAYLESESTRNSSRYLFEVVVPLRTRITHETQLQFNAMQIGVFQLLEARAQELEAGRRYIEALRDHWIARTRLESLLLGRMPQVRFGIASMATDSSLSMFNNDSPGGHQ